MKREKQEKMLMLIDEFEQLTYRDLSNDNSVKKMVLSAWIRFCDLSELNKIMGYDYFCEDAPECTLLNGSIYIQDFTNFLEYLEFTQDQINNINNDYED